MKKKKKEPSWDQIGKDIGKKLEKEFKDERWKSCKPKDHISGCGGAFYGLGFIGALVYYITTATGFWVGVLGVLKAIVWPAFLIFELMKFIGM